MRRIAALALSLCFAVGASASTDVIRKGFAVGEGGTLHLDRAFGNIKVVSGGTGVAVEITRKAGSRSGERQMREHKITFEQQGNDVFIRSDSEDHFSFNFFHWDDYEVQWNVRVPARYNLDLSTSGGSIDLANIGGTVEARTSGGSIKTGHLGGESTLKTSGGNITVAGAGAHLEAHTSGGSITVGSGTGPVEVKTSGGSITLGQIEGDVVARTSGGSIRIDGTSGTVDASTSGGSITARLSRQPRGDSRLSTSGGSVTVSLAPAIGVELDAHASGGSVHADIPVTVQGQLDENAIRGTIHGGGPKLVLRSSGGGIRVKSE